MSRYWVIGGEYMDTSFTEFVTGRTEERYGPFEAYPDAYREWQARARATMDFATIRYRIVSGITVAASSLPHAVRPVKAVAFDIIETVFSLDTLRAPFSALGLPPNAVDLVYTAALRDAMALACTGEFAPFVQLLGNALETLLAVQGLDPKAAATVDLRDLMSSLEPHTDAAEALHHLADAAVPIYALSNGAAAVTENLFRRAGLDGLMARILSVEAVNLAKPRDEVYAYAVREAGVAPEDLMLIATHPWDVHGAMSAGLQGGYVARGKPFPAFMRQPDMTAESLSEIVRKLF